MMNTNEKMIQKNDPLSVKTLAFALRIVKLRKYLVNKEKEFDISKQILRSGTNPGAMVREAAYAESAADFTHKLSIALKEINETRYWLEILKGEYLTNKGYLSLDNDATEIVKMLTRSILTKKQNMRKGIQE